MIFIVYVAGASLLIMGFRFVFPSEAAPIPVFSKDWRLVQGILDMFTLFPALVFSALVVPFGIAEYEEYYTSFSPRFFQRLVTPIFIAICAAVLYALVFFLALPLARDAEENMLFKGELYRLAKEQAQSHSRAGEWLEASQFVGVCDGVWPNSPELAAIRAEINVYVEENRFKAEDERAAARTALLRGQRSAAFIALPGQGQPVAAPEAIAMAETALSEGRFYDAHWIATVGGRIARTGSPEAATAARLAARAWNQIEAQGPNNVEKRLRELYLLKQSGYQAMVSGDWIRGFYIFQELLALNPDDPDAANFFAVCEQGTKETAFFIDEMEVSLGEVLTGAVFSLPDGSGTQQRAVLRVASLSASPDYAYGIGIDYMSFDARSRPLLALRSPYAKILPITLDGRRQVLVLMRALDRHDQNLRWEPEWDVQEERARHAGQERIILDVDYETFLLLSKIRHGLSNLQMDELFSASQITGAAGYVPQVFEAEILNRLGAALFFLPMSIVAIIIGWRFRARSRPRYLFFLLLPILPVVFNGLAHLYRTVFNTLGIALILTLGFSGALAVFALVLAVSFILSLILLAAQHG
jgi:hypothetical protein